MGKMKLLATLGLQTEEENEECMHACMYASACMHASAQLISLLL